MKGKKYLILSFLSLFSLNIISCNKDKESEIASTTQSELTSSSISNSSSQESSSIEASSSQESSSIKESSNQESSVSTHTHTFKKWENDDEYHWHKCENCGEIYDKDVHHLINTARNKACETCDYTVNYSQEEIFNMWILGRNYTASYNGDYSFNSSKSYYSAGDTVVAKNDYYETVSGNKLYSESSSYDTNPVTNEFEKFYSRIQVVKTIMDGTIERTKYYSEETMMGNTTIKGEYVAPNKTSLIATANPRNSMYSYYIDKGDTYLSLIDNVNNHFMTNYQKKADSLNFIINEDNSISFIMKIEGSYVDKYINEEGYIQTLYDEEYEIIVNDGKIVGYNDSIISSYKHEDVSKDVTIKNTEEITIGYSFNEKIYNDFSIETETTENNYYKSINFIVEGYNFIYSDHAYVYEDYSVEKAIEFLGNHTDFIISSSHEESKKILSIYTDKEMTIPFTNFYVDNNNPTNLYVKLTPPEDKAIVICTFKNERYERIALIYLQRDGIVFDPHYRFQTSTVLKVNGKDITDNNEDVKFTCEGGNIYTVQFAGN